MAKRYLMFDLEDEGIKNLAEILSSKVCKKILESLTEKDLSETDLAKELNLPINTTEYNLKKLIKVGLIEESKEHFWSVKGRKIKMYRLSNKHILIAPKTKRFKTIIKAMPSILISGAVALVASMYLNWNRFVINTGQESIVKTNEFFTEELIYDSATAVSSGTSVVSASSSILPSILNNIWLWFFIGSIFGLVIFLILNWRKLS